jgi:hypothetical protein
LFVVNYQAIVFGNWDEKCSINYSVEHGTYSKYRTFPMFILRTAVLFGYMQLKNRTFRADLNTATLDSSAKIKCVEVLLQETNFETGPFQKPAHFIPV